MGLEGKYEEVKSEGFEAFFKALSAGRPEGQQPRGPPKTPNKSLSISINGDQVTVDRGEEFKPTYTLNKEVDVQGLGGKPVKTKAALAGDQLTVESTDENGTFKRVYALAGSELTVTYSSSKSGVPQATRVFKKL
ncbi:fatty acid-binding protein, liver-like isoform X1 [Sitophilus oryzae]|uniref:Fatty acid-binding protein, liver-like isoform X1 n=1 Tax=Sitophilus oryzae TaxID=7048 RepID=A0A6J2YA73_SITOR|nr:fatty acid-binding protein, liver-like isoform X1 [Sitophilus oryzae]